jgi:hypothetical protein
MMMVAGAKRARGGPRDQIFMARGWGDAQS